MKNLSFVPVLSCCFALLLFSFTSINAADYYLSSSTGDDARTEVQAQNPSTPWKTVARLNQFFSRLQPGDRIFFKRGDVFEGGVNVTASGNGGSPLILDAYGSGDKPVISGLNSLSGWALAGNNTWEASLANASDKVNTVLLNGAFQPIGRYPNSTAANGGYLGIKSFSGNSSITDNQLSSFPNWSGGEVVIRKNRWVLDRNNITSHNGSTINYQSESGYHASANYGYFIQNHPQTLDQAGEWYFKKAQNKIGIYSPSGAPAAAEASVIKTLVSIYNQRNITIQNLAFKGANENAFELGNAQSVQLLNCEILFSGVNAVLAMGSNDLRVENCNIFQTNNTALELRGSSGAVLKNNTIKNTGIFAGMGKGDSGSYEGILVDGDNENIEWNQIENTGYIPITFRGNVNYIRNNFITNYNFVKDDGGGIYTWNNIAGAAPTYGSAITNNILLNGIGAGAGTDDPEYKAANGIYMDDNTAGVEIAGNTVANCGLYGLYVHNGHELTITNNTFYNSKSQLVLAHDNYAAYAPIRNIAMSGNIFFSKDNSQLLAEFKTSNNDIASFGAFNNNFYCRPGYENYVINTRVNNDGTNLDLGEWKALYGKDAGSQSFPVKAASYEFIRLEYNATPATKTFSLDGTYVDAKNTTYNGSITLAPFSSAVLVKQVSPSSVCANTGSITREQWNNTLNGDLSLVPFLTTPAKTTILSGALEAANIGDAYGSRIRGFICPPQTGAYTFWIAGDDFAELWLSTDNNPANKRKIANISGWTFFRDWDKNPSQKSAVINLQAGTKYYIEVLQKEGNGGDHVSVAWQLPDGTKQAPLPAVHLSPSGSTTTAPLQNQTISFSALPDFVLGSSPLSLTATASSGLPVSFSIVSGPAVLAGNVITPSAAGTVLIKASQPGNTQYNAAPDVTQQLLVAAAPTVSCSATGSILREQWTNIGGNDIVQIPFTTPASFSSQITSFEGPKDAADNYGSRIRGYICPPQSGNYTFFIAGDDATELWLSTDDNPSNKIKIAYNLSWTYYRSWNQYASQKSASIYLEGGKKYYIEALQKEGNGGDHLSVAWQMPNGVFEAPISGSRLSPYTTTVTSALAQTISFPLPATASLGIPIILAATASSGLPVSFSLVSGPAILLGNILTPTGAGTIAIKASQSGNQQYNAAPDVVRNLIVSVLPPTTACTATGSILRELWSRVDGNDVAQIPVNKPPSATSQLTLFEGPQNSSDDYGSRIRGYICPPQTGAYTFWIAGDDGTELWLSTDDNPANKVKIAYSLSWTYYRSWNQYASQKSVPVTLQAGKKYYIEALQKEGAGGDHVSVAWQLPGGVFEAPIAGSRLSPFETTTTSAKTSTTDASNSSAAVWVTGNEIPAPQQPIIKVFPNPFSSQTVIQLTPAETGRATLKVYDVSGRLVLNLFNGELGKGVTQSFRVNGTQLASGPYFISFEMGNEIKKLKLIRSK